MKTLADLNKDLAIIRLYLKNERITKANVSNWYEYSYDIISLASILADDIKQYFESHHEN